MQKLPLKNSDKSNCLLFLWIEDFRDNIKNQGFNFTSEFKIDYNSETKKLTIIKDPEYISSFYGDDIVHLKALIGENGAGKSSLLDFMKRNLANFVEGASVDYNDGNFISVFEHVIYLFEGIEISNLDELKKNGYQIVLKYRNRNWRAALEAGLGKINYVYYSNVFDYQDDNSEPFNLISVSTNYLLEFESNYTINKGLDLNNFLYHEFDRQFDFLSFFEEKVPFKLPDVINIKVSDRIFKHKYEITDDKLPEIIKIFKEEERFQSSNPNFTTYDRLKYRIFLNLLILLDYKQELDIRNQKYKNLAEFYYSNFDFSKLKPKTTRKSLEILNKIKQLFSILDKIMKFKINEIDIDDYLFRISFNKESKFIFYKFKKLQAELTGLDNFLKYSWREISSGEKAFLNIFSRLYYANKLIYEDWRHAHNNYEVSNIVLMIDEADLYLHPQWQKQFFSVLIDLLPEIWKGYKLQVILTSHSPILTSDIPKRDIIFIKKNDQSQLCEVINIETQDETFGANIHTLFNNAFYLNSVIGDFAKKKISEWFDFLSNIKKNELSKKNYCLYKKRIDMIGEPLLKQRLLDFLELNRSNETREEKIERLKKELMEAEGSNYEI